MSRELLILRHGKAKDDHPMGDWHRPLKKKGKRDAAVVASFLLRENLVPDLILTSTGVRAAETTEAVLDKLHGELPTVESLDSLYHASAGHILSVLETQPDDNARILVVGHNPGLSMLVDDLMGGDTPLRHRLSGLPKSGLAVFSFEGGWKDIRTADCHLDHYIHPKQDDWPVQQVI